MKRIVMALLLYGCGGGGGNMFPSQDMAGGMGAVIPDPGGGTMVDNDFKNVEPNDSPGQATPLGTAKGPDVMVWVNNNSTGGADTTDYFVFKSGPMAGQFTLGMSGLCWKGGITGLTATLWKVANGQQVMPPIHSWVGVNNCVNSTKGDAPVDAGTVYLLGVTATGAAGMYQA